MERIGRYQVERELGRGSMSIVYEALDPRIDRRLAIKVLREGYARDVASRQRFLREARAAGGLNHPNIVTVFDVGQTDGLPFIAMELLPGRTLADFLEADENPGPDGILDLAIQLAAALDYAHQRDVIHRDVKPANIHFNPETRTVKLMDFGIAAIDRGNTRQSGGIWGTPAFMAPEVIGGEEPGATSDLYALGVVLYRVLAGQLPWRAGSVGEMMAEITEQPPRPLVPRAAETPVELVELTRRLMAVAPADRPSSAASVLEELREIRSGFRRGLLRSVRQRSRAWRGPVVMGLVVAAALALGLVHVYRTQTEAMAQATYGYGDALASVIARETAESLILDDATALDMLVQDFAANPEVTYVHVSDRDGRVVVSTDAFLQGEERVDTPGQPVDRDQGSVRLIETAGGNLEFQVPVRFQARRVGEVQLGIDGRPLRAAASATLGMLALVFGIIVGIMAAGLAWLVRRQGRSIQRITWGLKQIARGQYDFRLEPRRPDEFSALYRQFNAMAIRLQGRHAAHGSESPQKPALGADPDTPVTDGTLDLSAPHEGDGGSGKRRDRSVLPLRKRRDDSA